jgi:hypothetical protein
MEIGLNNGAGNYTPYLWFDNGGALGSPSTGFVFTTNTAQCMNIKNLYPQGGDQFDLGSGGLRWANIFGATGAVSTSDVRLKENIINSTLGLDFINALRPVSYKFKNYTSQSYPDIDGNTTTVQHTFVRTHYGLIAQEVETVLTNNSMTTNDFAGFIHDVSEDFYGLRYEEFIAPLIKAVQQLTTRLAIAEDKLARNNIV